MDARQEFSLPAEAAALLSPFLNSQRQLILLPARQKKKRIALWYLAGRLEAGREYTEQEINGLLDAWHTFHDPATLRRELYNNRLLDRSADGSRYWAQPAPGSFAEFMAEKA